jgi:hypothetical protein
MLDIVKEKRNKEIMMALLFEIVVEMSERKRKKDRKLKINRMKQYASVSITKFTHLPLLFLSRSITASSLSLAVSVFLSLSLFLPLSVFASFCLALYLSLPLAVFASLCFRLYLSLSLSLCLYVCLPLSLFSIYFLFFLYLSHLVFILFWHLIHFHSFSLCFFTLTLL